MDVLWTRLYARAKVAYDGKEKLDAGQRAVLLADPMVQQVRDAEFALMAEAMARKRQEQDG